MAIQLEAGMVVEYVDGKQGVVMDCGEVCYIFTSGHGCVHLSHWNKDLLCTIGACGGALNNNHIVKVWSGEGVGLQHVCSHPFDTSAFTLLWERE